jgi:hypothetical protein
MLDRVEHGVQWHAPDDQDYTIGLHWGTREPPYLTVSFTHEDGHRYWVDVREYPTHGSELPALFAKAKANRPGPRAKAYRALRATPSAPANSLLDRPLSV